MAKAKLLYVEDDINLGFVTADNLIQQGYEIVHCADGKEALESFKKDSFALCILDVMLPQMDGFTLAKEIRTINKHVPIIFLTAKSQKVDRIEGLKLGADDYMTKPFSIEELQLKIEVFLKRNTVNQGALEENLFAIKNHEFNYTQLELTGPNINKRLTQKEGELLRFFALSPNKLLKREEILLAVWGDDDYFLGRGLGVFISRLRKYLEGSAQFENVHGVGFTMIISE